MSIYVIAGIDLLQLLQWPAMLVTALAAWLIAAQSKRRREIGFWCFLLSNGLWMLWGWHDNAYALMFLQVVLACLNIRGVFKNEPRLDTPSDSQASAR
ncbi:hypothetical protein [Ferribacterium limneticum]|uniref:hypothetical protein n=1 Tax=Ferribacterium limneticum TaxID=76259 RepID=UPI001CF87CFC|nr:hypothetical protein [Ferribacterium limneticum]